MTLEEFDQRPREDWDFCEMHDDLRGSIQERDERRERVETFRASIYALEERVMRLRAALENYGRHEEGCARAGLEFKLRAEDYPCTCGFSEALNPPAAPAPAAAPPRAPGGEVG